jgi:radical SAM superfamily enzyme YgiQ (UPF0313 family)
MRPRNVLLIYPRFATGTFWNYRAACEAVGRRYPAPPLGLITMAALLPKEWKVRLVDCNADALIDDDLAWADLAMTGGMLVQQRETFAIIRRCRSRGLRVAVGGPDATSSPHLYCEADYLVLGEVESILADFVAAVDNGVTSGRFEAQRYTTDIATAPIPRFDLLNFNHYLQIGVQFSRGCPFVCEFCDIIELYGRVPRAKSSAQMLAELDALYAAGWRGHVDFVDDNLIGNKKALKVFLPQLTERLKARTYPFEFTTEASLNFADDPELLTLLRVANFFAVFIGIESADQATLTATRKKQNTRRDIAASVHRIYAAGLFVVAGFIVGFDSERGPVVDATAQLIEEAAIPICMIGLLTALPNTELSRRLKREGRLFVDYDVNSADDGDHCNVAGQGLNFTTLRPRRAILADTRELITEVYRPERYFGRLRRVARALDCTDYRAAIPLRRDLYEIIRLSWRCLVVEAGMRREVWNTVVDCARHNPAALRAALRITAFYIHLGPFARHAAATLERKIAQSDVAGEPTAAAMAADAR